MSVDSMVHNYCWQDKARALWPRLVKLSLYTIRKRKEEESYNVSWSKAKGQGFSKNLHFDP